jgi:hypothetical protein
VRSPLKIKIKETSPVADEYDRILIKLPGITAAMETMRKLSHQ